MEAKVQAPVGRGVSAAFAPHRASASWGEVLGAGRWFVRLGIACQVRARGTLSGNLPHRTGNPPFNGVTSMPSWNSPLFPYITFAHLTSVAPDWDWVLFCRFSGTFHFFRSYPQQFPWKILGPKLPGSGGSKAQELIPRGVGVLFWLIWSIDRGLWFTWWFKELPGPSIFSKRTPMPREFRGFPSEPVVGSRGSIPPDRSKPEERGAEVGAMQMVSFAFGPAIPWKEWLFERGLFFFWSLGGCGAFCSSSF